ncbi:MAG TPA: hypothetical protein PLD88_07000, partial [Candidatus Berkiella sp.]|nr:hypothetical protein [Candidatus Berkiella sp.]
MILIASSDATIATCWHKELESQFSVYEVDIHERRALDLCLKKVQFEVLVVDLQLLGESGVNEIASLRDIQPQLHIVIMAKIPDEREEISAIIFGAKAYCHFDMQ